MAYIYKGSAAVISEENQLFSLPNTLAESFETHDVELGPTTSVTDSNYIEFEVPASDAEFLMLAHTRFRCMFDLKKVITAADGTVNYQPIAATDSVSVVNNLLSSLWRSVEVSLDDKVITSPTNMYGYRALIENTLGYSKRASEVVLANGIWAQDNGDGATGFETFATNTALAVRRLEVGRAVELSGPLHISLFQQSRPLISGVKVRVRLMPQPVEFYTIKNGSNAATVLKASITKPRLIIRKMVPSPSYKLAVEKLLLSQSCKYPIERVQMKSITIPIGTSSITLENVVSGQLPKHVILCMADSQAFSGSPSKNPYHFYHNNLNYLALETDGRQIPAKALTPDFAGGKHLDAYEHLLDSLGRLHLPDAYLNIDRKSFANGNTMFGFDLTPSKSGLGAMALIQRGNMRVHLAWANPLPHTITLIMRLTYDNVIEITRDRLVNHDFVL